MIDELSKRRPTFDEANSHPVTLGDSQTWHLPKPVVRHRPVFKGGNADYARAVNDDPELALVKTIEEEDSYISIANMAAWLLGKNYDLSDDDLGDILTYDPDDKSPDRWPLKVLAVAYGRTGPKASSDGAA